MNFNTNTTVSTSAIAELYTLKQDLMAELVRAQVKHEFKDMSATIDYIQEGLVTVNQSIKEEMASMSKSTVLGIGSIVNGRITYVSRNGGVSRPMGARFPAMGTVTKESFMDADYKPTLDVRFPTVQPTETQPMEDADYDEVLEGEVLDVRFPMAQTGPVVGEDFDEEPSVWVRDERAMDAYDRIFGINK